MPAKESTISIMKSSKVDLGLCAVTGGNGFVGSIPFPERIPTARTDLGMTQ